MSKYKVGDQVVFKYQYNYRVGFIDSCQSIKYLNNRKSFIYHIKDMSLDICIKESNILNRVEPIPPKPYRIKIVDEV